MKIYDIGNNKYIVKRSDKNELDDYEFFDSNTKKTYTLKPTFSWDKCTRTREFQGIDGTLTIPYGNRNNIDVLSFNHIPLIGGRSVVIDTNGVDIAGHISISNVSPQSSGSLFL